MNYPNKLGAAITGRLDMDAKQAYVQQKCAVPPPATELAADLHNLIDAQGRAIHFADTIGVKIFGPIPEPSLNQAIDSSEHLTAMVARARRQAEEIANRLEGISANI